MKTTNLDIDRNKNQKYFDLIEKDHGELMDRWNELQSRILKVKIPSLMVLGVKKELKQIGSELKKLGEDYIRWNNKAGNFLGKPNYVFKKDQDPGIVFLHYSNMLRHVVNSMESDMRVITDSYNKRWDQYKGQRNFIIAITSFILTFLGLVAAIISIINL